MSARRDPHTTERVRLTRVSAPPSRGACLVIIHGPRLGQCIDVHDVPVVIGRSAGADFQVEHSSVSRLHVSVWHEGGRFYMRDLGSTNGTSLNEKPALHAELAEGDRIGVGETVFKFVSRGSLEARYHEALYQLATMDSLTQLYNRRKFREFLEEAVAKTKIDETPLALAFIDLDHFKSVNDRLGHAAGDEVLRAVAAALRGVLRRGDTAGRLGGEEFAVLMPGTPLDEAMPWCEDARQTIFALQCEIAGAAQRVTASIGLAAWQSKLETGSELMRSADMELFRAKAGGRNRVCVSGR